MTTDVSPPPRPEDFGLSLSEVGDLPTSFIAPRSGLLCILVLTSLVVVVTVTIALNTGSVAAGIFLGSVFVVASLVLLLPLTMLAVCFAGRLEERWRSARDPSFRACLLYRRELEAFEASDAGPAETEMPAFWLHAGLKRLQTLARNRLGEGAEVLHLKREESGADMLINRPGRTMIVRCETGPDPTQLNVARELSMARIDSGADDAILLAPAGCTEAFDDYARTHHIRMLDVAGIMDLAHD